jgi:hypothetical protein
MLAWTIRLRTPFQLLQPLSYSLFQLVEFPRPLKLFAFSVNTLLSLPETADLELDGRAEGGFAVTVVVVCSGGDGEEEWSRALA